MAVLGFTFFPFAGSLLCNRGSDRLSYLSDDPGNCVVDSVVRPLESVFFNSVGMKRPLHPRVSALRLIVCC